MKYLGIENPSFYDSLKNYSLFNYDDEVQLEEELFTVEIIELKINERFKEVCLINYLALISPRKLLKEEIDLEGLEKFILDEGYDLSLENIKIVFVN